MCGSGLCLAMSIKQGRPNHCITTNRKRENEKECPTCGINVPESSIQQETKKRLRA